MAVFVGTGLQAPDESANRLGSNRLALSFFCARPDGPRLQACVERTSVEFFQGGACQQKGQEVCVEELNGRMIACQILVTGLIARVANDSKDPLRFLTDFRDEIHAVVRQVRIAGALDTDRVRAVAIQTVDELFSLMKPPSTDE
jgi:hypothetical protein